MGDPHMMGLGARRDESCLYRAMCQFDSNKGDRRRNGGEARGDEGAGGRRLWWKKDD